jgi:hypothetical protein
MLLTSSHSVDSLFAMGLLGECLSGASSLLGIDFALGCRRVASADHGAGMNQFTASAQKVFGHDQR